jgi:hypothetical protein
MKRFPKAKMVTFFDALPEERNVNGHTKELVLRVAERRRERRRLRRLKRLEKEQGR